MDRARHAEEDPRIAVTARQLNRATLKRQLLLEREPLNATEAVRRVVALQAQEAASPYVALWNRTSPFAAADLDAAFANHEVVKAPLMRITLHAVHREDYPAVQSAMLHTLRSSRLGDTRFTSSGLSIPEADALVSDLVAFAEQPRSTTEILGWLEARVGGAARALWWALRTFSPLFHTPTGGPWSFETRPTYLAADPAPDHERPERSVEHLVWRYLEGFGPASVPDMAQFALIKRTTLRRALQTLSDVLVQVEGPDGVDLFDVPDATIPDADTPAPPRLLPMWESSLLAYHDRSRVIPPDYRKLVTRRNGDVLPTLLVDGYVAGVWRAAEDGIQAMAFHELPNDVWSALSAEAASLITMLADRQPDVYGRYGHWWDKLPAGDVRTLPG